MYNALLERVVKVIQGTVGHKPEEEQRSEFYNLMFDPDAYMAAQEKRRKKEERTNQLIVGATALAVLGELYHIGKRSGIIDKIRNRK